MFLWIFSCIAGMIYIGYMFLTPTLERDGEFYSKVQYLSFLGNFIFACGSAFVSLTTAVSLSVTFLLLDRIFILTSPMQYKQNREVFVLVTIIACILLVISIVAALILTELPVAQKTSKYNN
jgi:hypothetical protein